MKFYAYIGANDSGLQYYEKLNCRNSCNRVFKKGLRVAEIRDSFAKHIGADYLEKYVNALLGDITWAYDEALTKIGEIKEFEGKVQSGQSVTPKEEAQKSSDISHCSSVLGMAYRGMCVLRELIATVKEAFFSATFLPRMATIFNMFMNTTCGDMSAQYQVMCIDELSFKSQKMQKTAVIGCAYLSVT